MEYVFKFKRMGQWFWRKRKVIGHKLFIENDKMCLYFEDSLEEISEWSKCDLKLGQDWMLAEKKHMEKKSGQSVKMENDL